MNSSIKKNCIIKCNLHTLHRSYVFLKKQNILNFWYNVSKKFSTCLKILSTHMENVFQILNSKFKIS